MSPFFPACCGSAIILWVLHLYITHYISVSPDLFEISSEDGQLTETCKGNKYLQIESLWVVLTVIL
jgi:hypothetical protein